MHKSVSSVFSAVLSVILVSSSCCIPAVSAFSSENYTPRLSIPENNPEAPEYNYYYTDENVFVRMNYGMPNCTAYASGRANEILGEHANLSINSAHRWYNENKGKYSYGCVPKLGAVACWSSCEENPDDRTGHVAVTEVISEDRGTVTVSESQWYRGDNKEKAEQCMFVTYTYKSDSSDHLSRYKFLGYIYIDEKDGTFYGDAYKISANDNRLVTYSSDENVSLYGNIQNSVLQNFRFEPCGDGNYRIWSVSEDKLLKHSGGSVEISSDSSSSDSKWKIMTEENGKVTICSADNITSVLTYNENGLAVSDYNMSSEQLWSLSRVTGNDILQTSERNLKISIDTSELKKEYVTDEVLNLDGLALNVNGTRVTDLDVSKLRPEYDFSSSGERKVIINYDQYKIEYTVNVAEYDTEKSKNVFLLSALKNNIITADSAFNCEYDLNNDNMITAADAIEVIKNLA